MNILEVDEEKFKVTNSTYYLKLNKENVELECNNNSTIIIDNYIKNLIINLKDNVKINISILNNKKNINSNLKIIANNNTNFYLYSGFLVNEESNLKIINEITGDNNKSKIKLRGISSNEHLNIYVDLKVKKGTIDNELTEDIKGITDGGKISVSPVMEIDTHEVIANHFVTISSVDKDQLFYLENKGISYTEAKKLILKGFINNENTEVINNE